MRQVSMNLCEFQDTLKILQEFMAGATAKVVNEIKSLFGIVDEESITFALMLSLKREISMHIEDLKSRATQDVLRIMKKHWPDSPEGMIKNYVNRFLIVEIVGHNRSFESRVSGSDFGLFLKVPKIETQQRSVALRTRCNGVLIQAKRNALANKGLEEFRQLSRNKRIEYTVVQKFMTLGLYRFAQSADERKLSNISFVRLDKLGARTNEEFMRIVNCMLPSRTKRPELSAGEFYGLFLKGEVGTKNRQDIQNYILGKNLPYWELKIYFEDSGDGLRVLTPRRKAVEKVMVRVLT